MNYFENCKTIEEVKKTYRKLALKLHPDCNEGTGAEFIEMSKQYEKAFERVKNTFTNAAGEHYEKENPETFEEFKDIIDKIIHFQGVKIEIIGNWIWVSGGTFEYKEQLKTLGFKWSGNKKAWSWHNGEWKKRSKKKTSMDDIRNLYGSSEVKTNENMKLA